MAALHSLPDTHAHVLRDDEQPIATIVINAGFCRSCGGALIRGDAVAYFTGCGSEVEVQA